MIWVITILEIQLKCGAQEMIKMKQTNYIRTDISSSQLTVHF